MTEVCLVGNEDVDLRNELLGRETSREALLTYELRRPWRNTIAMSTVSLGAAVSLLNDLNWYLTRFTRDAMVRDPSISEEDWLSRRLAQEIRGERIDPTEVGEWFKVYGVVKGNLVDPMYLQGAGGDLPTYDLREVDETVRCRITRREFG